MLPAEAVTAIRRLVERRNVYAASCEIGISREAVARIVAGLGVYGVTNVVATAWAERQQEQPKNAA